MNVVVLMACHNRQAKTLRCLARIHDLAEQRDGLLVRVVLVDDGNDGTGDLVRDSYPTTRVLNGSGGLYWAGAMALAQNAANLAPSDELLWLNDDVDLADNALKDLMYWRGLYPSVILVGATSEPGKNVTSYTGARLTSCRPGSLRPVEPHSNKPQSIDTFNGNIVLVPPVVWRCLGAIDSRYIHAYGDIDYGLRAKRQNFMSLLLPGYLGLCARNSRDATWMDSTLSRRLRFQLLLGRKGLPIAAHWLFNTRHGGWRGVVYFAATYLKALARIALKR